MATRFVVDFGEIEMTKQTRQHIEKKIQSAALSALGEIDFQGDFVARFPRDWFGGIIVLDDQSNQIESMSKKIKEFAKQP